MKMMKGRDHRYSWIKIGKGKRNRIEIKTKATNPTTSPNSTFTPTSDLK
jgi:hypothetical protein